MILFNKSEPFLLNRLPQNLRHVEVCSPGELKICKAYGIPGSRIIYSGVNKEIEDVTEAIEYGVDIATAESILHVKLEQEAAKKQISNRGSFCVLLAATSLGCLKQIS